ncbi:MAG: 5'/3'-nucleotidase SurE [bacterium]
MKILLTNDDGLDSIGLEVLYDRVKELGDVIIIAPEFEQSASSHRITLRRPVFVSQPRQNVYAVSGSPTDCIVLALRAKLFDKPDLVISGINAGYNMGEDILYSGTVAAATEASLSGIPSIAVSTINTQKRKYYQQSAEILKTIVDEVVSLGGLWNLNVPGVEHCKGIKLAHLGHRIYDSKVEPRYDPYQRSYYWLAGDRPLWIQKPDTDCQILEQGYASLTPFKFTNMEDKQLFVKMNQWLKQKEL